MGQYKRIKMFEEYGKDYHKDKYYQVISGDEKTSLMSNLLEFTQEEIDKLYNYYGKTTISPSNKNLTFWYAQTSKFPRLSIIKLLDEWYIITLYNKYGSHECHYKCDQWGGLIKCLNDID